MRSNFLKQKVPEKKPEPVVEEENKENANPNVQPDEDDDRVVGDDMKGEKEFPQPGVIEKQKHAPKSQKDFEAMTDEQKEEFRKQ